MVADGLEYCAAAAAAEVGGYVQYDCAFAGHEDVIGRAKLAAGCPCCLFGLIEVNSWRLFQLASSNSTWATLLKP